MYTALLVFAILNPAEADVYPVGSGVKWVINANNTLADLATCQRYLKAEAAYADAMYGPIMIGSTACVKNSDVAAKKGKGA